MSAALDRLSELERAAAKSPWRTEEVTTVIDTYDTGDGEFGPTTATEYGRYDAIRAVTEHEPPRVSTSWEIGRLMWHKTDAEFIVAARNALPALLAVARAAEACESEWTALGALDGPDDLDDDFDALRAALAALDAP